MSLFTSPIKKIKQKINLQEKKSPSIKENSNNNSTISHNLINLHSPDMKRKNNFFKEINEYNDNSRNTYNKYKQDLPKLFFQSQKKTPLINSSNSKNITVIKTDVPISNSDNSFSSSYNSSARTFLFYEPKIRKFNSMKRENENISRNKKKNSTLSYFNSIDNINKTERNISLKKDLPDFINNNIYKTVCLTERNENKNLLNNIMLKSISEKEPIKINTNSNKTIINQKQNFFLNKNSNTSDKSNIKRKPIKFSSFNNLSNNNNTSKEDKRKFRKKKETKTYILNRNSFNLENNNNKNLKLHYNSDDGGDFKKKIIENINKNLLKTFTISSDKKNNSLSKISEVVNDSLNKSYCKSHFGGNGKETIKQILLGKNNDNPIKQNLNANSFLNLDYSNDSDFEDNSSGSVKSKKEIQNLSFYLNKKLCLSKNNIRKIKVDKKNLFENQISDKLISIQKNININQDKTLILIQKGKSNLIIKSQKDMNEKLKKNVKKGIKESSKIYISYFKKDNELDKKIKKMGRNYLCLLKIKNKINLNRSFIQDKLFPNYFELDIYELIFMQKYFGKYSQIINNQTINNFDKNIKQTVSQNSLAPINYDFLPRKDFLFICSFYKTDFEYEIKNKFTQKKFIPLEQKKNNRKSIINKNNQTNRFIRRSAWKFLFTKEMINNKKENNKFLLNNALSRNNFYSRYDIYKKKSNSKKKIEKKFEKSKAKIHKRNNTFFLNDGYVNKFQMLSRVDDLKHKIIQSLNKTNDSIFFYIKDRNFPGFKNFFEKFKINPDLTDKNGNSLLILAVKSNCFQIVNYLINKGSSVNFQNKNNNTPLHFALTLRNFEIADMLIKQGADEQIPNKLGILPWQCLDNGLSIM